MIDSHRPLWIYCSAHVSHMHVQLVALLEAGALSGLGNLKTASAQSPCRHSQSLILRWRKMPKLVNSIVAALAIFCLFASCMRLATAEAIRLETDHDVYRLPVQINGMTALSFILDSGASVVQLPEDLFQSLTRLGIIKAEEVRGTSRSTLANGSTVQGYWLMLHSIAVGSTVISNVEADVVPAGSQPLLGQSFLRRLPRWSIDNNQGTLVIDPARQGAAMKSHNPIR